LDNAVKTAKLLGITNNVGFENFGARPGTSAGVLVDTFRRLSTLREVDPQNLKEAGHCGGLPSRAHLGIAVDKTCPGMENLGNDEYRKAGKYLLGRLDDNQQLQVGFDNVSFFEQLSEVKWGVFFRACLAASHIAYNAEWGRSNVYRDLQGGSHGTGDTVAAFLVSTLTVRPFPWTTSTWR